MLRANPTPGAWYPFHCLDVLRACLLKGMEGPSDVRLLPMEAEVTALGGCLGGCLRVKYAPLPFSKVATMRAFTVIYGLCAAVAFVPACGYFAVIIVSLFSLFSLGVQTVADRLEQPFGLDEDDLPLDTFCKVIRRECQEVERRLRTRPDLTVPPAAPAPSLPPPSPTFVAARKSNSQGRS